MPGHRRLGTEAEDAAAERLRQEGWTVVTRRYKARHGEIDLVALDGETLVFVEVKARTSSSPEGSIGEAKIAAIAAAAGQYMAEVEWGDRAFRFDIVAIGPNGWRHHRNVFRD